MKTSTKRELHHRANIHSPKQILQNFNTTVFIDQKKKKKRIVSKSYQIANTTKKGTNLIKFLPHIKPGQNFIITILFLRSPRPSISKIPSGCMDGETRRNFEISPPHRDLIHNRGIGVTRALGGSRKAGGCPRKVTR